MQLVKISVSETPALRLRCEAYLASADPSDAKEGPRSRIHVRSCYSIHRSGPSPLHNQVSGRYRRSRKVQKNSPAEGRVEGEIM